MLHFIYAAASPSSSSEDSASDIASAVWKAGKPLKLKMEEGGPEEGEDQASPAEDDTPPTAPFSQCNFVTYGLPSLKFV